MKFKTLSAERYSRSSFRNLGKVNLCNTFYPPHCYHMQDKKMPLRTETSSIFFSFLKDEENTQKMESKIGPKLSYIAILAWKYCWLSCCVHLYIRRTEKWLTLTTSADWCVDSGISRNKHFSCKCCFFSKSARTPLVSAKQFNSKTWTWYRNYSFCKSTRLFVPRFFWWCRKQFICQNWVGKFSPKSLDYLIDIFLRAMEMLLDPLFVILYKPFYLRNCLLYQMLYHITVRRWQCWMQLSLWNLQTIVLV